MRNDNPGTPRWRRILRLVVAGLIISAFAVTAILLYRRGGLTGKEVAGWLDSMGSWAPMLFSVAFVVGLLIGLPGLVFIVGARLAFGPYMGFVLAYGVGVVGMMVPFAIGRGLRSDTHWMPKNKWLAKVVTMIEHRPLTAVILLRLFFWFNSPVAYALATSQLRWRDYVLGCVIALFPVVLAIFIVTAWFL